METRARRISIVLLAAIAAVSLFSLCMGTIFIPVFSILESWQQPGSVWHTILFQIRLPRIAGAIAAGAALSVSGMILQSVLNNPLAAPNLLGVHTGAGCMIALVSALFPASYFLRLPASFAGAMAGCMMVFLLASKGRASRITIVLAGMAVSQIFSAGTDLLISVSDASLAGYADFKIGSLASLSFPKILPGCICILVALVLAFFAAGRLEILSLGEETARSLGLQTGRWRFYLLFLAAVLSASAVSFCGMIGFIGLLCPQILRRLKIWKTLDLLITSALAGAFLLLFCDLLSRILFAPFEIPVGILLSLLGAPFFLWLLLHERRRGHD